MTSACGAGSASSTPVDVATSAWVASGLAIIAAARSRAPSIGLT